MVIIEPIATNRGLVKKQMGVIYNTICNIAKQTQTISS